jgi:hypothetical protein
MPVIRGRMGADWAVAAAVKARRKTAARTLKFIMHL